MAFTRDSNTWRFIKSILIMALILWPFYYIWKLSYAEWELSQIIVESTQAVFAPVGWLFAIACATFTYCIHIEYPGVAGIGVVYAATAVLYGYGLSLIWGWVSVPQIQTKRRKHIGYIEHDDIF